nr:MAG TPA: hypothetical protein [Caudoviricetes sp.]
MLPVSCKELKLGSNGTPVCDIMKLMRYVQVSFMPFSLFTASPGR